MKLSIALVLVVAQVASAQPQPAPQESRVDAKQLMQSGVKLLEAKDYLGALAVFKDAYRRFPSAKILINIGTTLKLLGRNAEAANAYQRFLDAKDTDPARTSEVKDALADLDKSVATLVLDVQPADAQLQINSDEPLAASEAKLYRVAPGKVTIAAHRDGYKDLTKGIDVVMGEKSQVDLRLDALPKPEVKPVIVTVPQPIHEDLHAPLVEEEPRSRIGAMAMVHVSVAPKLGSAWLVGATADATEQLEVDAALMLGPGLVSKGMASLPPPSFGAYAGASFAFLTGQLRPRVSAGLPVFFSDGARFSFRAAGGIEYVASRQLSVNVDFGVEYELNPENDIRHLAVVPALGVAGRL